MPSLNLINRTTLVQSLPPGICAEIGVYRGGFAQTIYATNPKHLYLIDCWEDQVGEYAQDPSNQGLEEAYNTVLSIFADKPNVTIIKEYSHVAATYFPDEYFDWLNIDANHFDYAVTRDMTMWYPKVKSGGYMIGHDYVCGHDLPFLQVRRAVNRFVKRNKLELMLTNEPYSKTWIIPKS